MKYCPMKPQGWDPYDGCYPNADCDVEDCSWWDGKQCAILSIAQNLKALNKPPAPGLL